MQKKSIESNKDKLMSKKKLKAEIREKGITLVALVITIIVLLILAGITINSVIGSKGILNNAKKAANAYNKSATEENEVLDYYANEMEEASIGKGSSESTKITYTDTNGNTQTLAKGTTAGTKVGTTVVDGQTLDWYLFDVSDDGKTAYLVSTPTYWVPDTTKVVSGAYTPKLVSSPDSKTGAIRQAIQEKESGTAWDSYTYEKDNLKYTPSDKTWNYYKSVNSQWSAQRGSTAFASLNENEQAACYLADADIFAGIKDQVNNANGNLKGKIKSLVGGASAEQWCNAYNKQSAASSSKITCEYRATSVPGYIYKVNGNTSTVSNSEYWTGNNTIYGDDIYGAANKNGDSSNPFYSYWWLASPSSNNSYSVCLVYGINSNLSNYASYDFNSRLSLFASVAL